MLFPTLLLISATLVSARMARKSPRHVAHNDQNQKEVRGRHWDETWQGHHAGNGFIDPKNGNDNEFGEFWSEIAQAFPTGDNPFEGEGGFHWPGGEDGFPHFSWGAVGGGEGAGGGAQLATSTVSVKPKTKPTGSVSVTKKPVAPTASITTFVPEGKPTTSSKPKAVSTSKSATKPSSTGTSTSGLSTFAKEALEGHNTFRAEYGASPLKWNATLAKVAQQWSNQCNWTHSGGAFGENLAAGYGTVAEALAGWEAEASSYSTKDPQASHFTQMVWKATTEVGCAVQSCDLSSQVKDFNYGKVPLYTCEYNPPGNVEPAKYILENVGSKTS